MNERLQSVGSELITHAILLGALILLLWLIEGFDQFFWHETLDFYGIQPRTTIGLRHIFFAPFLHKGFNHLIANSAPFLVLGWFVLLRGVRIFVLVSVLSAAISGLGVWLLARPATIHIGMSGVIFGYLGFLLFRGYFERSSQAIALAIVAGFLYGGMIWGVLPLQPNISWLGHLFGFIGGALLARQLNRNG
jgi:membrane associated rhomboid family serine protease